MRDAPPKAIIKVAIHLKDGSGLFETIRPDDFGGISGDRTLELSEPPAKPGELIRGVFLTLEDFDGKNGAAAIGVVPFGWTGSPIELKIPSYGQCAGSGAVAQIVDMNICTHQNQNG